jgi:hypothetical protein
VLRRLVVGTCLTILSIGAGVNAAYASDPVTCPLGQIFDRTTGTCVIVVATPPAPPLPDGGGSGSGSGGGSTGPQKCLLVDGTKIPCRDGGSWWSNVWGCYVKATNPQPPKSDAIWQANTAGAIYDCYDPLVARNGGMPLTTRWSATAPAGPAAPPDPAALARQAIAVMQLHAIRIGIVPEPRPGSVGIIGMPTWMWAENRDRRTWGPITRSASAGGFTVTATATVGRVVWSMGDGATVTCTGSGTPYADSYGKKSSPTCGHTYTRQGTYTVRATSYWTVRWNGLGRSGTIPLNFTDTMGEAQVLNN